MPCDELLEVLRPAFSPCCHFKRDCKTAKMRWDPQNGHVPRGFCGGFGRLSDVEFVLIIAEPAEPQTSEKYSWRPGSEKELVKSIAKGVFDALEDPPTIFHKNLKYILNNICPNLGLHEQLKKTWITDSVLCSAPKLCGPVSSERTCVDSYLVHQLRLLKDSRVVALGRKAERRTMMAFDRLDQLGIAHPKYSYAWASAPPGANRPQAKKSWDRLKE